MKYELIVTAKYLATIILSWGIGWFLVGEFEGAKDFAISSVACAALYGSIWLAGKSKD
jgi:hypothetical protein